MSTTDLKKRTWHYTLPPAAYEMTCEKCGGSHLWWSEYESHVWCYDCEIDFDPKDGIHSGVFSGPISLHASNMMGCIWDRFNMEKQKIEILNLETQEYVEYDEPIDTLVQTGVVKALLTGKDDKDPYGFKEMAEMRKHVTGGLYDLVDKIRAGYGEINGCS